MARMRPLTLLPLAALLTLSGCRPSPTAEPTPVVTVAATVPEPTAVPTLPPTTTPTMPPTATFTPLPPTATSTPLPPTATFTPLPPTATSTPAGHFAAALGPGMCRSASGPRASCGWLCGPYIASPDRSRVAWSDSSVAGDPRLYLANPDGSGRITIPAPSSFIPLGNPVWSPDSRRIAFTNCVLSQPGGGDVYVVNADGSGLLHLASYVGYHDELAWSGDSTTIAYSSGVTTGAGSGTQVIDYRIYAVRADGLGSPSAVADGCQPIWVP